MTANDIYVQHREGCARCDAVDSGIHGQLRCQEGQTLVRAAARELRERGAVKFRNYLKKRGRSITRRTKPFITAQDFIFMRDLRIKL